MPVTAEPHNSIGEGRLPGAVRADDGVNMTFPDFQVYIFQDLFAAEDKIQVSDVKKRHIAYSVFRRAGAADIICGAELCYNILK